MFIDSYLVKIIRNIGLSGIIFLVIPMTAWSMNSANYRIDAYEINSVGGVGSSANYKLVSSGGEPFAKEGSSSFYKLGPGFAYEVSYGLRVGFHNSSTGIYKSESPYNVMLGNLQAGSPATGSTDIVVMSDNPEAPRYNIAVKRNDPITTMDFRADSSIDITDKTAWDPAANSGNGNAETWSGTGLGFCVISSTATKNTTWWGVGSSVNDANNKYAGFPATAQTIMDQQGYSNQSTTTTVGYKLDVPAGQPAGGYDGVIVYYVTMAL